MLFRDQRAFYLMFAAAVVVSLVTGLHVFIYDLSRLLLAMLLVARHFATRSHADLRIVLGSMLVMLWMPPLFLLPLACNWVYLWFLVISSVDGIPERDFQSGGDPTRGFASCN